MQFLVYWEVARALLCSFYGIPGLCDNLVSNFGQDPFFNLCLGYFLAISIILLFGFIFLKSLTVLENLLQ